MKKNIPYNIITLAAIVLFLVLYIIFGHGKYEKITLSKPQKHDAEVVDSEKQEGLAEKETEIKESIQETDASGSEVQRDEDTQGEQDEKEKGRVLKIGMINDLHVKASESRKVIREKYSERIEYFIEKMNNDFHPDFIVINGDVIEGTDSSDEFGMFELELTKELFDEANAKKYWVLGNHDLRAVNKEQWKESLDIDYLDKFFEVNGYGVMILDVNFQIGEKDSHDYVGGQFSEDQLNYIEHKLEDFDGDVIIFSHYPLFRRDKKKNELLVVNKRLGDIFDEDGDVLASFTGHTERLYFEEVDNVWHYVAPGIIRNSDYEGFFSEITIANEKIMIDGYYLDDDEYKKVHLEN